MKSIIHVNRQNIAMNRKDGGTRPIYTIKRGGKIIYAREIEILGPSRCVTGALKCGAAAWIETEAEIKMTDPMTFKESREIHGGVK